MEQKQGDGIFFYLWRHIESLPRWAIEWWQSYCINQLVHHAYRTTHAYKDFWGVQYEELPKKIALADLEKLPVIAKKTFKNIPSDCRLSGATAEQGIIWAHTSGTTGTPLHIAYPRYGPAGIEPPYEDYHAWRFLVWHGIPFSDVLNMPILEFRMSRASSRQERPFLRTRMLVNEPEAVIAFFRKHPEIDVVGTYGSVLLEFARVVDRYGADDITLRYCICYGDVLTDEQRAFIEKTLQCELHDQYSTEECWVLGTECAAHDGFHIHEETYIVEIVDENDNIVPDGEHGKVVITNLFNYTMPLIRYAIGDNGRILSGKCKCGLRTKRLKIEGRDAFYITLGRHKIHYITLGGVVGRYSDAILQYQLQKTKPDELTLALIPAQQCTDALCEEICSALRNKIGPGVAVRFEYADRLERAPSGKNRLFVDKTKNE